MTLSRSPNYERLYTSSHLTMNCAVQLNPSIDTRIIRNNTWSGPDGVLHGDSRIHISKIIESPTSYRSVLKFVYLKSTDSGNYSCSVTIADATSSSYITDSETVTVGMDIFAGMSGKDMNSTKKSLFTTSSLHDA